MLNFISQSLIDTTQEILESSGTRLFIEAWHGSRRPFELPFQESFQGSENDEGFSGRGFYFFADESDVEYAVPRGYKRKFKIELNKAYNLDKDDIFSRDTNLPYSEYRDLETLRLLNKGYDGAYRTLNGKLEEICVFSYKREGYDGNQKIETIPEENWKPI